MRSLLVSLLLIASFLISKAATMQPDSTKKEVFKVVQDLFLAMETNDSTLANALFTKDAELTTIYTTPAGEIKRTSTPASKLGEAFASEKQVKWSEPIWDEVINIDGGLASVWVDYAFYAGKNFSHCGVDAFHLVKTEAGWKIFHLADTRRRADCEVPDEIKAKYE